MQSYLNTSRFYIDHLYVKVGVGRDVVLAARLKAEVAKRQLFFLSLIFKILII